MAAQSDYSSTQSPTERRKFKNRIVSNAFAAVGVGFGLITVLLRVLGLGSEASIEVSGVIG
jgi:hypothetical protein